MNMHERLMHFIKLYPTDSNDPLAEINSTDLINYRAKLSDKTEWYLSTLSGFLKKWHSLSYPGVTNDAAVLLNQLRLKGNRKGEAVLTHDPHDGPFTDIEIQSIQAELDRAYEQGRVALEPYLLVYLFMLLGQRPTQYAALKIRDVSVTRAKDRTAVYILHVPRAKQRHQISRTEFKERVLAYSGEVEQPFRPT